MAKKVATYLGVVFLVLGVVGFFVHDLLGTHLSMAHNLVHLITGAIFLYLGMKGTESIARTWCLIFGAVYLLLGAVGFFAGEGADRMLAVIPGELELGTMDHVVHLLLGAISLVGGLAGRR